MLIEQFDAKTDDDRLAACHQISVSGHAEDDPDVRSPGASNNPDGRMIVHSSSLP
jgi:hypothetical protein